MCTLSDLHVLSVCAALTAHRIHCGRSVFKGKYAFDEDVCAAEGTNIAV